MQFSQFGPLRVIALTLIIFMSHPGGVMAASSLDGDLPRKDARPLEEIPGVDSHYGVFDAPDGSRLRTIVAVPEGRKEPLPAILFTQWVSCGSIEYRPGSSSREILARLAWESGMALLRVERASDGDSLGPSCDALDFDTEFSHYLGAFTALLEHPLVDKEQIVVYGSSLGAVTAPLLAEALEAAGHDVDGLMVQGGGGVTYLERMINFDRINLERRRDVDPAAIHTEMNDRIRFQYEYLVRGRHPDDVAADSPAMARVRSSTLGLGEANHYGRPFAWHQQIAARNILKAWQSVDAKVLVVFNGFDQFEARHGHRMIVDMVNRWRPGSGTYVEQAKVGHSDQLFENIYEAYADIVGGATTKAIPVPDQNSAVLLAWLKREGFGGSE